MKNIRNVRILLGIGALLTVLVTATPAAAASAVKGAGADSPDPLIGAWQTAVAAPPLSTSVDYSADGSAAGRDQFITNGVDFAVTGIPFTTEELAKLTAAKKTFVYAPVAGGSLAFVYHLFTPQGQSIKGLQLSGPTLAKIFTGTVTNWNDAEIIAENPGVTLPPKKIIPTVRGQADGATYVATSFFRYSAPAVWKTFMEDPQRGFVDEPRELFPFFAGVDSRTSSFAIADVIASTEGSDGRIGYVDNAWAKKALAGGADIIKVKNAAGSYVAPTPVSTAKTLAAATIDNKNLLTINFGIADPTAYPIAMINYMVIPTSGLSAETGAAMGTFARYGLQKGQDAAAGIGDPALPSAVVTRSLSVVENALPATPVTTTTTTTTTLPTDVSANDVTNPGSSDNTLAFTGGPDVGVWLGSGGALFGIGFWLRRRVTR